jgi:hypothetical protein
MVQVASLLIVLLMSLIITRVATVALTLTGMSYSAARFQARSALTGAGFTTNESERVVTHPLRRRIIMALMLIGNTGLVLGASLMVVLLLGNGEHGITARWQELLLLLGGLVVVYMIARSRWVERGMRRFIEGVLERSTDLPHRDYASLLRLRGDYRVVELAVEEGEWLAGSTLRELDLPSEGVLVLGVSREDGRYVGAPRGDTRLASGDVLLVYGRESQIADLDRRGAGVGGQLGHAEAVARQRSREAGQEDDGGDDAGEVGDGDARGPQSPRRTP